MRLAPNCALPRRLTATSCMPCGCQPRLRQAVRLFRDVRASAAQKFERRQGGAQNPIRFPRHQTAAWCTNSPPLSCAVAWSLVYTVSPRFQCPQPTMSLKPRHLGSCRTEGSRCNAHHPFRAGEAWLARDHVGQTNLRGQLYTWIWISP